jgi:Tfp pilus assembly protein PilO
MVLSRRERIAAIITLIVVGALLVDKFALTPALKRLQQVENQKQELLAQINEARNLFERRRLMERKWKTMSSDGLQNDADVESRIVRALDKWSQDTRLTLTSVKPERLASDKGLKEITFVVAGRGRLDAVARFLWQVETAELPVKVKDMQLGSTSEAGDSMSLQLRLSALYLDAQPKSSEKKPAQPEQPKGNNEEQLL